MFWTWCLGIIHQNTAPNVILELIKFMGYLPKVHIPQESYVAKVKGEQILWKYCTYCKQSLKWICWHKILQPRVQDPSNSEVLHCLDFQANYVPYSSQKPFCITLGEVASIFFSNLIMYLQTLLMQIPGLSRVSWKILISSIHFLEITALLTLRFLLYVLVLLSICIDLISGGSYCSFPLLHYSSYYMYCSKKMWIILLIFITALLILLLSFV